MCVCVCVCVCVSGSSHSDDKIWHNFLGQETHTQLLSRLRSINEYLVIDCGGKDPQLLQSPSVTGVLVGLRVPTPRLASQSMLLQVPGQAPGDCLARPIAPASCTETQPDGWGA